MSELYEEIYQKTQDYGRTQFVELLQQNQIKIEQLQQENKELKKQYSKLEDKYIKNISCCNEKDCDLYKEYLESKNILTEFEKWLEEKINSPKLSLIEIITFKRCLEELQELKEGKK